MKKLIAIAITGLLAAAGAHAQNPAGTSSQQQVINDSKPQEKAQAKVEARPQGEVKKSGGDQPKSAQHDAIGTGKAAAAGQAGVKKREARHPKRKAPKQGGTPDMAGAK